MQMDVAISLLFDRLLSRASRSNNRTTDNVRTTDLIIIRITDYDENVRIAKDIMAENDIIFYFFQKRVAARQFDYECPDEAITEEEEKFRIEYYLLIIDKAIQSFNERFKLYQNFKENFGFLYSFHDIKNLSETKLKKNCNDLHIILQDEDDSDINGLELFEKLRSFIYIILDNHQNVCLMY